MGNVRSASMAGLIVLAGCADDFESTGTPFVSSAGTSDEDTSDPDDDDGPGGGTGGVGGSSDSGGGAGPGGDPSGDPSGDPETTGEGESTGVPETGGDPGCYFETLDPDADVTDIVSSYGGGAWKDDVIGAMQRRWPAGAHLLEAQRNDPYFDQFSDPNNWEGMVNWLDTLVHEQTHLFNAYHAIDVGEHAGLYMREDLILFMPPDQGFARAEIYADLPAALQSSIYADTYLSGQQGERGFNSVLDELSCYVNEVPGLASFGEYFPGGVSLRDGSAAFLVFLQYYLRRARTQYPDFYTWAQSQEAYVEAVRLLWLRTHFFYEEVGDSHPNLGISDGEYRAEMHQEANIDEIRMFTGAQVGPSSCVE